MVQLLTVTTVGTDEIRLSGWKCIKNGRPESNLKQFLLVDSAESGHYGPTKPAIVATTSELGSV